MIKTATQLKAKVRNVSQGDSLKAQTLIRNYFMERFLERISISPYKDNFVLKGGMLVAAVVGLDSRATMDIDTTVKFVDLSMENAEKIVREMAGIDVGDGVSFFITKISRIMEEHDYPGIRFMLEARMDKMKQSIKMDISTGDVITPAAVTYAYKLMFEERSIALWTYNLETLLAEKMETIMARDTANTRMRDFYDIHILILREKVEYGILKAAFLATSKKRGTSELIMNPDVILGRIEEDSVMQKQWDNYVENSSFIGDLSWATVMSSVKLLAGKLA
ncbi:MAG: nucleotidyl transferase AbiEii/AbiGii toxin family protein [Roseburia sp.]|nr:nucleotidyl transferase AbiEii/AbiGii toxin family protein [Roseburia sp.]